MSRQRKAIKPDDVLSEACRLAEELGTPPPQGMIAENLGCSQQHVSNTFMALEYAGAIKWINRWSYTIINATWTPPPEIKV